MKIQIPLAALTEGENSFVVEASDLNLPPVYLPEEVTVTSPCGNLYFKNPTAKKDEEGDLEYIEYEPSFAGGKTLKIFND